MKLELFDQYDVRARICPLLFFTCPFVFDALLLIESVRSITGTAVIVSALLSYVCLFSCFIRYLGNKEQTIDYIAYFLSKDSSQYSKSTKRRYYSKIIEMDSTFSNTLNEQTSMDDLKDVSTWLREKTRGEEFKLIKEENMNYGFIRNAIACKKMFLWVYAVYSAILLALVMFRFKTVSFAVILRALSVEQIGCAIIHVATILVWSLVLTKDLLEFAAQKYAMSVIRAIDMLREN